MRRPSSGWSRHFRRCSREGAPRPSSAAQRTLRLLPDADRHQLARGVERHGAAAGRRTVPARAVRGAGRAAPERSRWSSAAAELTYARAATRGPITSRATCARLGVGRGSGGRDPARALRRDGGRRAGDPQGGRRVRARSTRAAPPSGSRSWLADAARRRLITLPVARAARACRPRGGDLCRRRPRDRRLRHRRQRRRRGDPRRPGLRDLHLRLDRARRGGRRRAPPGRPATASCRRSALRPATGWRCTSRWPWTRRSPISSPPYPPGGVLHLITREEVLRPGRPWRSGWPPSTSPRSPPACSPRCSIRRGPGGAPRRLWWAAGVLPQGAGRPERGAARRTASRSITTDRPRPRWGADPAGAPHRR